MYRKASGGNRWARRLHIECLEDRRVLSTATVTVLSDLVDGETDQGIPWLIDHKGPDGKVSLREAIEAANSGAGTDTLDFAPTILGDNQTIGLTEGELAITDDVTITGPGKGLDDPEIYDLTISGNNSSRIFNITGPSVEISGLKLTGGDAEHVSNPANRNGGAIRSEASPLVLDNLEISNNQADVSGGMGHEAQYAH